MLERESKHSEAGRKWMNNRFVKHPAKILFLKLSMGGSFTQYKASTFSIKYFNNFRVNHISGHNLFFLKAPYPVGQLPSCLILSAPQTSVDSILAPGFCSLLDLLARHLDKSSLSVPVPLSTPVSRLPPPLSFSFSQWVCVMITTSLYPAHFM